MKPLCVKHRDKKLDTDSLKNILLYLLFILSFKEGLSQNLVQNFSFEQYDTCTPGQNISIASGWKSYSGSPDYFSACADSSSGSSVPYNVFGYELAANGVAYSGFYSYQSDNENIREYVGRTLLLPLNIGTKYFISFKVKPMTTSGATTVNSGIGLLFSTQSFKECAYPDSQSVVRPPPNYASIYSQTIISDTLNWTTISGYFTADSTYQYFEIGTMFSDTLIDTLTIIAPNPYPWQIAYYLLDEVIVEDSLTMGLNNLSKNNFSIYPNPTSDQFYIETNATDKLTVDLYDVNGRHIYNANVSDKTNINVATLDNGIYTLTIKTADRVTNKKLVIVH